MTLVTQYFYFKYGIEQLEIIFLIKHPYCFLIKPCGSDLVKFRLLKAREGRSPASACCWINSGKLQ